MLKPHDLLENVLLVIEKDIKNNPNEETLSADCGISPRHLRRLFKFAFNKSLGDYIRSRRLSASLEELYKTNGTIFDIALKYGFEYEQSYIRAFKREFGLTPGDVRKSGRIVTVTPPIHLLNSDRMKNYILLGPEIVMVPQFHLIGKLHKLPHSDSTTIAPQVARQFWEHDRALIPNAVNPQCYIGLLRNQNPEKGVVHYLPSVQVTTLDTIPPGFYGDTFTASLCARFRYIGRHHYYDINTDNAKEMYEAIEAFNNDDQIKYGITYGFSHKIIQFERIDTQAYDGTYCQMEWFTPVFIKK
jgi:AraC family transcriptional regulator